MKPKQLLVIYQRPKNLESKKTLQRVEEILKKYKVRYRTRERNLVTKRLCRKHDFIIIVGGDGTLLRASHSIFDAVVLGVNADVSQKEGYLMPCNKDDFDEKFQKILTDDFNVLKLIRLEGVLNEKEKLTLALNEFYIGHRKPYKISRYNVHFDGKKEFHKDSGLIVGTPTGSTAWAVSAGGKKLPLASKDFQFVAREPYEGRLHQHAHTNLILKSKDVLEIESLMDDMVVVVDSLTKEFKFNTGSRIKIKVSDIPLKIVRFK